MGLDDEALLARVASEMDFDFSDTVSTVQPVTTAEVPQSECRAAASSNCEQSSINEDLLFDKAYDLYEASMKIS